MLEILERIAIEAGQAILDIYRSGPSVSLKSDRSPVTDADEQAERMILEQLELHFPTIPVVAEEATAAGVVSDISSNRFFLVDPLDGTREFISNNRDFTVNIALIDRGEPVLGVVYAPALGVCYSAAQGKAEKFQVDDSATIEDRVLIGCRIHGSQIKALASRSHRCDATNDYIRQHSISDVDAVGSSLKFCLLAEGVADIYPRFSRTMEWDTAAGDAILRAAGGETLTLDGRPLLYGKINQTQDSDFANPAFVSRGRTRSVSEQTPFSLEVL